MNFIFSGILHTFKNFFYTNRWPIIIATLAGIITIVYDLWGTYKERTNIIKSSIKTEDLIPLQMGAILSPEKTAEKFTSRRAVLAEIFHMAQEKYLKLFVRSDDSKNSIELTVEVNNDNPEDDLQEALGNMLIRHNDLKEIFAEEKYDEEIGGKVSRDLIMRQIISRGNIQIRKRLVIFTILLFFIPALIIGSYGLFASFSYAIGLAIFLIIVGIGRFFKIQIIPFLSKEGLYLKKEIIKILENRRKNLEQKLKSGDAEASGYFYEVLPYIIINPAVGTLKMKKYRRKLGKLNRAQIPDWISLENNEQAENVVSADISGKINSAIIKMIIKLT